MDDELLIARALAVTAEAEGMCGGRHFTEWVPEIVRLKQARAFREALALCYECIAAVERAAMVDRMRMPYAYTEHAAIIHRKRREYVEEIAVLHRYSVHPCGDEEMFADRITASFRLLERLSRDT